VDGTLATRPASTGVAGTAPLGVLGTREGPCLNASAGVEGTRSWEVKHAAGVDGTGAPA